MDEIKIQLTDRSLINRFGATPTVRYDWAMQRIKEGKAIIFREPAKVPSPTHRPIYPQPNQHQESAGEKTNKTKSLIHFPEIVWLQDNNCMGGAELSSQVVIDTGLKLGYDIYILTPQNFNLSILRNAKLIIINNIWTFTPTQMVEVKRTIFEFQVPYVKYEHDMRELYESRLSFSRRLFRHSKFNVFISPLHIKEYQKKIHDMSPCHVFPLAIDLERFKPNPKIKRDMNKVIHTSGNLHNKGAQTLFAMTESHPEMNFEIFTGDNNILVQMFARKDNVKIRTRVDNKDMPDIYSSAGYLVHLPIEPWAGERVVLEAVLCGCKLRINDNVGHNSWGWDFEDVKKLREELGKAPYDFWREVEKLKICA